MSQGRDILKLEGVGHSFGGFTVLRSVTLSVPEGGLIGLIGPNGSGKTTLFNIISGYLPLRTGAIAFRGEPLTTQSVQDRNRAGMVRTFQTPKIFERMTVLENIMVGACKLTRTGMIQDLLRLPYARSQFQEIHVLAERMAGEFGLDGTLSARTLPAGPRRVLEIARAFVGKPKLLMLDEPSAGLNREEIQALIASIQRLNKAGLSILLVSHDMELMAVAETVYVLNFGEILAKGSMAAIQQDVNVREVYLGV